MILGNVTKIRRYDLDILNNLINTTHLDTDIIDIKTLNIMKEFALKYSLSIAVMQADNKVIAFSIGNDLPQNFNELELQPYTLNIFFVRYNTTKNDHKPDINYLKIHNLQTLIIADLTDKFNGAIALVASPKEPDIIKVQTVEYINKYGIQKSIEENKEFFRKERGNGFSTAERENRAILVGVGRRNDAIDESLEELKSLCDTDNIEVVGTFSQTRKLPDKHYYIGVGKLDELKALIVSSNANMVIVDDELNGSRKINLEDYLEVKVIDRSMLILDIFAKHATSNEGRLQVSLAQMKYSFSRLSAYQHSQGRFGGGVGMRGPGETKMELAKRVVKNKIYQVEKEVEKLKVQRELRRQNRKQNKEKIVALIGYTNAGKSTLLNRLTKSNVLAENKLFATLDTTTRELYLGENKKILLTDTVGFINKLPHEFIDAFSSTLEESLQADLLLVVVDNSSPYAQKQLDVVQSVLKNLNANNIPQIIVANKVDNSKSSSLNVTTSNPYILVSAKTGQGLDELKNILIKKLF